MWYITNQKLICTAAFYFFCFIINDCIISVLGDECNTCSPLNNLACVSETQFQVCVNDLPTGTITSCPPAHVCSTNTTIICQPQTLMGGNEEVEATCNKCNLCDATNTFACTDVHTYALCLGKPYPTDIVGNCGPYHVCNINYLQICGNIAEGVVATCPTVTSTVETTTMTTTTLTTVIPNPTIDTLMSFVNFFCQAEQSNQRFALPLNLDTTCQRYIYCFVNGGNWSGQIYNCPGNTFFNKTSELCTANKPIDC